MSEHEENHKEYLKGKPEDKRENGEPAWCIVANIVTERAYGPKGSETRRGTRQFAPGAKIYIVSFQGTGREKVTVMGRHRKSHRYIMLVMPCRWLVNWRVELVYSPHVVQAVMTHEAYKPELPWYKSWIVYQSLVFLGILKDGEELHWAGSVGAQAKAEAILEQMQEWHESARRVEPYITRPPQQSGR